MNGPEEVPMNTATRIVNARLRANMVILNDQQTDPEQWDELQAAIDKDVVTYEGVEHIHDPHTGLRGGSSLCTETPILLLLSPILKKTF